MKANLTLKLDSGLIREVKVLAAKRGTSISAMLAETLASLVTKNNDYERAREGALAILREGLDLQWQRPSSRDEIHER